MLPWQQSAIYSYERKWNPRCVPNPHCECQELKPKVETNTSFLVRHPFSGVDSVKTVGSHLKLPRFSPFSQVPSFSACGSLQDSRNFLCSLDDWLFALASLSPKIRQKLRLFCRLSLERNAGFFPHQRLLIKTSLNVSSSTMF